jgi:SAM-dependent methyltransferase
VARLVVSPDAVARFASGSVVLHNARVPHPPLVVRDVAVLEVLLHFAQPADPAALRARLPDASQAGFDRLVAGLGRAGILVAGEAVTTQRPWADRLAHVRRQIGLLAGAATELAADVAALGPEGVGAFDGSGVALEQRLDALIVAMGSLRDGLDTARQALLARQMAALRDSGLLDDLKLHVGAGARRLPGWVNIDVFPAELALNVNRGLPFADGSARLLFASHMLEHLYYPQEALRFLAECRRVLRPGGRLRLVVPDIELYVRAYAERDDAFFADRRRTWEGLPEGRTHLEEFLSYAGAGPDPAAFLDSHKYGYDFATLSRLLALAGFEDVRRSSFMGSDLPELRVDEQSAVAGATSDGRHYSLFVEASTPAASPAPRPAP